MIIGGRQIGPLTPPYIVAEMSANHNGSLDRARDIITAAKESGADAVKIQVYNAEQLASSRGGASKVVEGGPWRGRTLLSIYKEGEMPRLWLPLLFEYAAKVGISLFASVFDAEGFHALRLFDCPAYKIASFEIKDLSLIRMAASDDKPVILSGGVATLVDLLEASQASVYAKTAVLHCVSNYPCPIGKANLSRILGLRKMFPYVGFSDHTLGVEAAIASIALGACIVEKHLTLKRSDGGLDADFSSEPHEFRRLVDSCRDIWSALQLSEIDMTYGALRVEPNRKARNVA